MHIYPKYIGPVSPDTNRAGGAEKADEISPAGAVKRASGSTSAFERSDRVEISDAGRALAARDGDTPAGGLDPARAAAIRGRIMSGAYDTLEVVDAVARRLLGSGDL